MFASRPIYVPLSAVAAAPHFRYKAAGCRYYRGYALTAGCSKKLLSHHHLAHAEDGFVSYK